MRQINDFQRPQRGIPEAEVSVKDELREFITDNFMIGRDSEELTDSGSLLELGIIDSTGVLELVGFLESEYGIEVKDDELVPDNLDSITRIENYVRRKKA